MHFFLALSLALLLVTDLRPAPAQAQTLSPTWQAQCEDRLTHLIQDQWLPWVDAQMKHTPQRHSEIDTPEEYARKRSVCGGEIALTLDTVR